MSGQVDYPAYRTGKALATLLDAAAIGPDQVRYHRLARDLVRDIRTRPRPPRPAVELGDWMGVRPGGPCW
ncbi:hypothetical protein [Salinispora arenicola]|uniref:hypothetical protein n=1 Tax=Salinispora arenicola TaxID=168697 RepID=UPI00037A1529|nr:hypothetical protein [Salinispora arenicola]